MGKTGKKTKCENRKSMIWVLTGVICIFSILIYYLFFSSMTDNGKERFLYIDKDDNDDSVYIKVDNLSTSVSSFVFRTLGKVSGYDKKIKIFHRQTRLVAYVQEFSKWSSGSSPSDITIPPDT